MYNQSYDEYLRSVLGVNNQPEIYNNYNNLYTYQEPSYYRNSNTMMINTENLENEYPEIYRIIYPMVRNICERNIGRQITRNLLEDMINEIYENIEPNMTEVNVNVQVSGDSKNVISKTSEKKETRETRQRRNQPLHDLIKILILRELGVGAPTIRPRPPFLGGPGRPPMMPGPMRIPYGF